ncbi:glucan 1,3-beta-glucosidase [Drechslerella dactyloides]|uniref:glucan 1,3-beta-glucosidase n=1 Tax=Drechslerella dactyloides TaxID=74499 RepID=A0AAD6NJ08_DREDA|nr:glucan 1,3-beta-glucosidase [Drechslerella dactyloides]
MELLARAVLPQAAVRQLFFYSTDRPTDRPTGRRKPSGKTVATRTAVTMAGGRHSRNPSHSREYSRTSAHIRLDSRSRSGRGSDRDPSIDRHPPRIPPVVITDDDDEDIRTPPHARRHSNSRTRRLSQRESRERGNSANAANRNSSHHRRRSSTRRESVALPAAAALVGGEPYESIRASRVLEKDNRRRSTRVPPDAGVVPLSEESLAAFNKEEEYRRSRALKLCAVAFVILLIIILVPIGVLVIGKNNGSPANAGGNGSSASTAGGGGTGNGIGKPPTANPNTIPTAAKGTVLDPFTWYDTRDFNTTYTDATVGGLSVMGLNMSWDDGAAPNPNVPALNKPFSYGKMPMRGVNIGGWLLLEPFITPSLFNKYDKSNGVVDEYTLSKYLGAKQTAQVMEKHYATFVTEQTFQEIAAAGLDHVRIPYPYWIVTPETGDPYLPRVGWRYLLRGIEWARKYGLRVKLDLHSVQGGQNGWNHSGRQGVLNWLNGTDGAANGQKVLDMHDQLSQFFAQPRYKNIITLYGLVNEPRMTALVLNDVLNWTANAYEIVRGNGLNAKIVFGDGFLGLENWKGKLAGYEGLVLDVHQYVIFNIGQIAQTHTGKIQFACSGWGTQMTSSNNPTTGFGPTMVGEFGQADTDCVPYLNNVGTGSRWEGNLIFPDPGASVTTPSCHGGIGCSCDVPNSDPSKWSTLYKEFLLKFAEAQMESFEQAWGWMYWTWDTEDAYQWSYKKGIAAGTLPTIAYERNFSCTDTIPDYGILGMPETF